MLIKIQFSGDTVELSLADKRRLEELSEGLVMLEQPVQIRVYANASIRDASRARRLALQRLIAVRGYLIEQGVPKVGLILHAIAFADNPTGDDRLEIAALPSSIPLSSTETVQRSPALGLQSQIQLASSAGMADRAKYDTANQASQDKGAIPVGLGAPVRAANIPVARQLLNAPPPQAAQRSTTGHVALRSKVSSSHSGAHSSEEGSDTKERSGHSGGAIYVQLGSHEREETARNAAQSLKRRFPALLTRHEFVITTVDLEGRGRFHRVRTGPFSSNEEASALCSSLKQQNQDCLVVVRGTSPLVT